MVSQPGTRRQNEVIFPNLQMSSLFWINEGRGVTVRRRSWDALQSRQTLFWSNVLMNQSYFQKTQWANCQLLGKDRNTALENVAAPTTVTHPGSLPLLCIEPTGESDRWSPRVLDTRDGSSAPEQPKLWVWSKAPKRKNPKICFWMKNSICW